MIYFLRHGETDEDNPALPKFSGPGAIPLNDKGREQMRGAADWFKKNANVGWLLTSPVQRSHESAIIVGSHLGVDCQLCPSIGDWHIGAAAGCEVARIAPFVSFFERNSDIAIPGGEQYSKYWNRSDEGRAYLLDFPVTDLDLVAVTHSRFIATSRMVFIGRHGIGQTDFSGSPKPGGIVAVAKNDDGSFKFDLVYGQWNGDTR